MRSILARLFLCLALVGFLAISLENLLSDLDICPGVQSVLFAIYPVVFFIAPLFAGLAWDDPEFAKTVRGLAWFWIIFPAVMLVIVVAGLIIEPPDIPDAWYVLIGVAVWNLLLPLGLLIGRRVWGTS